jgi:enolase-phosphatase E1
MPISARLILLDIEGTVSPLAFVRDVMFPFAAQRYQSHLAKHFGTPEFSATELLLRADAGAETEPWTLDSAAQAARYCAHLTAQDRKATGLKAVQGQIWDEGFASGELKPPLFPDVKPALEKWAGRGLRLAIYSSGSEHAQKQFFTHTLEGDLCGMFEGYFDTTVGAKREPASYGAIATKLAVTPRDICFFSDVVAELEAARAAGLQVVLVNRPGNAAQPAWQGMAVTTLEAVEITSV